MRREARFYHSGTDCLAQLVQFLRVADILK